jgi:hypothetical protein
MHGTKTKKLLKPYQNLKIKYKFFYQELVKKNGCLIYFAKY